MGYGLGVFLLAIGLILALAVRDSIDAIDVTLVGWILAGCGVLVIVLQALQANRTRASVERGHDHPRRRHPDDDREAQPGRPAAHRLTLV